MAVLRKSVFVLALAMASASALACDPRMLSKDWHIDGAQLLGVGYVSGERNPDFEARVLDGEFVLKFVKSFPYVREVRVVPAEIVVGPITGPDYYRVPCDAPFPRIYDRVLFGITSDGWHWVLPAEFWEREFRLLLK
jgi:hypothetical protein